MPWLRLLAATPSVRRGLLGLCLLPWLASCGNQAVQFRYPQEEVRFPAWGITTHPIYFGIIRDLRPEAQKQGQGRFTGIAFPADDSWEMPVTQIYREALVQDLIQTDLVELVPLVGQADFTLAADILSFGCSMQRSATNYLLPLVIGLGIGFAWGETQSDRLKRGALLGAASLIAIPLPTKNSAEAQVLLRLRDRTGDVVWEERCLGEIKGSKAMTVTEREDQKLVDRNLTRALKRCNACLLGKLRQDFLMGAG